MSRWSPPPGPRTASPRPPVGPAVAADLPHPVESTLPNGLRLVVVERHDLPLVTATLVAAGGAALDPVHRAGTASLTATLLTKGTTTRSATDIAQAIAALGGSIASDADRDGASVDVTDEIGPARPCLDPIGGRRDAFGFRSAEIESRTRAADRRVTVAIKNPRSWPVWSRRASSSVRPPTARPSTGRPCR